MMKERTLRVLEFTKIRERLASKALTPMGAELCMALVPSCNLAEIELWQSETEEATVILQYLGSSPLVAFEDVRQSISLAEKGATLSPKALLTVASLLASARAARSALDTERENTPLLKSKAQGIVSLRHIEQDITNAIISEEEIADRASSELMNIRRHLRGATERIKEKLNQMVHNPNFQKYLSDSIITVRNDRYVIPVRADCRSMVPGLVHDVSSTGSTYFVEPMSAVNANNALRELELKEKKEIERILAELSGEAAAHRENIDLNFRMLVQLDVIFAKAKLSYRMRAWAPIMNDQGRVNLRKARHPLIDPKTVVPISVRLGTDFDSMIITGPNTGGKTVTLKTIGLLTLMAECGLHIPAGDGSECN